MGRQAFQLNNSQRSTTVSPKHPFLQPRLQTHASIRSFSTIISTSSTLSVFPTSDPCQRHLYPIVNPCANCARQQQTQAITVSPIRERPGLLPSKA